MVGNVFYSNVLFFCKSHSKEKRVSVMFMYTENQPSMKRLEMYSVKGDGERVSHMRVKKTMMKMRMGGIRRG